MRNVFFVLVAFGLLFGSWGLSFLDYEKENQNIGIKLPKVTSFVTPTLPSINKIEFDVKSALLSRYGRDREVVSFEISNILNEFASGSAVFQNSENVVFWYSVFQDEKWSIVYEGQQAVIECDIVKKNKLPREIISYCLDENSNTILHR